MPKVPKRKIATQDKAPSSEYSSFLKQQRKVNFHRVSAEIADHFRYRPNAGSAEICYASLKLWKYFECSENVKESHFLSSKR